MATNCLKQFSLLKGSAFITSTTEIVVIVKPVDIAKLEKCFNGAAEVQHLVNSFFTCFSNIFEYESQHLEKRQDVILKSLKKDFKLGLEFIKRSLLNTTV